MASSKSARATMLRSNESAAVLDLAGRLTILADEAPLQVDFRRATIEVVFPDLWTALRLRGRFSRGDRRAWANSFRSMTALTGLELRVWVGGLQVGRIAATSKPGWLAVWLGLDPLELRIGAILATLLGQQSRATDARTVVGPGTGDTA